jgi:hypothetical protein
VRLLIAGSRDWQDETPIRHALERTRPTVFIHGAARGADSIAARLAYAMGIEVRSFPADWSVGRAAGVVRNQRMLDEGQPDWVIGFADDLLVSRGTRDMIERSVEYGVERVYHYSHVVGWRTVKVPGKRPNYNLQRREAVA